MSEKLVLSIVTIHLDEFDGLSKTLRSLLPVLSDKRVEWIVIDGGSVAQTGAHSSLQKQVRKNAARYISESDDGIYDAMNKGTRLACGEFVLYMNAGDELHPDFSMDELVEITRKSEFGMIWGKADVRDRRGVVYSRKTRHPRWLGYGTAVFHQAVIFRTAILGSKPYNTDLRIAADYNLMCRLYTAGEGISLIDMPVCIFDLVGASGTNKRLTLREESTIRKKYFSIPAPVNGMITAFKYALWQMGTMFPAFRRAWSRYF